MPELCFDTGDGEWSVLYEGQVLSDLYAIGHAMPAVQECGEDARLLNIAQYHQEERP